MAQNAKIIVIGECQWGAVATRILVVLGLPYDFLLLVGD